MIGAAALNASLGGGSAPFSDEQLEVLVDYIDKDKDGYIGDGCVTRAVPPPHVLACESCVSFRYFPILPYSTLPAPHLLLWHTAMQCSAQPKKLS